MAGVTDLAFRTLCKSCGADLVVSEMVSSRGLHYKDKKTGSLLKTNAVEAPLVVQIFGNDPRIMAESAKILEDMGVCAIDINMGCPAPKIVKNGDGCALMNNEILAGKIAETVVQAVSLPVSIKFRAGWDEAHQNAVHFAKVMESSGAAAVTVHGRTREQFYSGAANWQIIKQIKDAVSIPVIGNGDVKDGMSALSMLQETGCDSIMVGRGALGNPFVFRSIKNILSEKTFNSPTLDEMRSAMLRHIALMRETKPERVGVAEMRKHFAWYLKGLPHASRLKVQAFSAKTYEELANLVQMLDF